MTRFQAVAWASRLIASCRTMDSEYSQLVGLLRDLYLVPDGTDIHDPHALQTLQERTS